MALLGVCLALMGGDQPAQGNTAEPAGKPGGSASLTAGRGGERTTDRHLAASSGEASDVDATVPPASELVAVNESATVGSWQITLAASDLDARAAIDAGDDPHYDGLAGGEVLVLTTASVENTGDVPLDPGLDLLTGFLGNDGVEYNVLNGASCAAEDSLLDVGALAPGQSAVGTVCQGVPGHLVDGGSWVARPAEDYGSTVAFALR